MGNFLYLQSLIDTMIHRLPSFQVSCLEHLNGPVEAHNSENIVLAARFALRMPWAMDTHLAKSSCSSLHQDLCMTTLWVVLMMLVVQLAIMSTLCNE